MLLLVVLADAARAGCTARCVLRARCLRFEFQCRVWFACACAVRLLTSPTNITRTQWIANLIAGLQSGYEPLGTMVLVSVYSCVMAVCFLPPPRRAGDALKCVPPLLWVVVCGGGVCCVNATSFGCEFCRVRVLVCVLVCVRVCVLVCVLVRVCARDCPRVHVWLHAHVFVYA
jgi:hypothetical protein